MNIEQFLVIPYERNARGPDSLDCWGLVRLARHHLFNKSLLDSFSCIESGDTASMTREVVRCAQKEGFVACEAKPGAIATAWRGRICPHVGIVVEIDGRLRILDTNINVGARLQSIQSFSANYTKVVFYDD